MLIGAVVALSGGGALLHITALSDRVARRDALRQEALDLRERIQRDHIRACVDRLREQVHNHDHLVTGKEGVSHLLQQLARDLTELGARDRSLHMNPIRDAGSFMIIPLSLRFEASLTDAHELLKRLATHERLVAVQRLSISRDAGAPIDQLLVVLDLNVFARPSEEGQ